MAIEHEATFANVDKDQIRVKLKEVKATLIKPEFLQKRVVFDLPGGVDKGTRWLRVRNEGDKITLSLKELNGIDITDQKEICLKVDNFEEAVILLENIGSIRKSYQETKRELWVLGNAEIAIDEWPFLEPFVEIEGPDEKAVKEISEKIGFDWSKVKFCTVDTLYNEKYGVNGDKLNKEIPRLVFEMENPFL